MNVDQYEQGDLRALLDDPKFIEEMKRGLAARREGRMIPWSKVKAELHIAQ